MGVGIWRERRKFFALVNGIVLTPLRYPDADRLVRIFDTNQTAGIERTGSRQRQTSTTGVAGILVYRHCRILRHGPHRQRERERRGRADGASERRLLLPLAGVPPTPRPHLHRRRRCGGRVASAAPRRRLDRIRLSSSRTRCGAIGLGPHAMSSGKSLLLDRRPFTIVGVMPDGLALPEAGVRLWIPWNLSADLAASVAFRS